MTVSLDVLDKYKELIKASTEGESSIYVKTTEYLNEIALGGTITGSEKAQVLSEVLSAMVTATTNASMSTAMLGLNQKKKQNYLKKIST